MRQTFSGAGDSGYKLDGARAWASCPRLKEP